MSSDTPLNIAARAPAQCHARNAEADRIVGAVPEKIERIGPKRDGLGSNTGDDLHHEHAGIDDERNPEHPAP